MSTARKAEIKTIPKVPGSIKDAGLRDFLSAVKNALDTYQGVNSNTDVDKVVRFADLIDTLGNGVTINLTKSPLSKSQVTVSGTVVRTGRIESDDGKTYFDLDNAAMVFNGLSEFWGTSPGIFLGLDNGAYKLIIGHRSGNRYFAYDGNHMQMKATDDLGNVLFDVDTGDESKTFLYNYADQHQIEHELMKMNYQYVSWAQFAIFDIFSDETKRSESDPSTYPATVKKSRIYNGDDLEPSRAFGFVSKTYSDITTILTGTSTSVGENFLRDTAQSWYTNENKNLTLVDPGANEFNVESNDADTLTVVGTPLAGAYSLIDSDPAYAIAFMSYSDQSNGGYGDIKLEVSFDNGSNYQTFYDSSTSTDILGGTVDIANPGTDYIVRITLTNDENGKGPEVYNFLVCTDPSPWRY